MPQHNKRTELTAHIGQRIKTRRGISKLTGAELADLAGVGLATLTKIESGGVCSLESFYRIAVALRVSTEQLLPYRPELDRPAPRQQPRPQG